jgi:hypothetical protein
MQPIRWVHRWYYAPAKHADVAAVFASVGGTTIEPLPKDVKIDQHLFADVPA